MAEAEFGGQSDRPETRPTRSPRVSGAGMTPVVESTVGDQKAWPDLVVTRTRKRVVEPPERGGGGATTQMLVSLNCNAGVATADVPGNSVAGGPP